MSGFPGSSSGKEPACQCRRYKNMGSIPGSGRCPGGGCAIHSSILAWRIPWTEKPGGLQSMGSQRAGHDWVTDTFKVWLYHAFNWKGDIRKKTKTKTQDIVSYKKHSLDLDWIDWMQIVLVIYIKLAVQLDSYLEASVGQWQHIYSVAMAIPCHGIYHHVGGETWAP